MTDPSYITWCLKTPQLFEVHDGMLEAFKQAGIMELAERHWPDVMEAHGPRRAEVEMNWSEMQAEEKKHRKN